MNLAQIQRFLNRYDGGPGSGNWGHVGRPGQRGGSGKGGGAAYRVTTREGGYESLTGIWKKEQKYSAGVKKRKELEVQINGFQAYRDQAWHRVPNNYKAEYLRNEIKAYNQQAEKIKRMGLPPKEELERGLKEVQDEWENTHKPILEKWNNRPDRGTPEREEWNQWKDEHWEEIEKANDAMNAYMSRVDQYYAKIGEYQVLERVARRFGGSVEEGEKQIKGIEEEHNKAVEEVKKYDKAYLDAIEQRNAVVTGMFGSVDECRTMDDVNDYLKTTGMFKQRQNASGVTVVEAEKCNLSGITVESAKDVVRAYEKVGQELPFTRGEFGAVRVQDLGSNTYGNCSMMYNSINFSVRFYGDRAKFAESYDECVRTKFHPKIDNGVSPATAVAIHEMGHAVDAIVSQKYTTHTGATSSDWFSSDAIKYCKNQAGVRKNSDVSITVSRYATTNNKEFFAECFSEYYTSSNPSKAAVNCHDYMMQVTGGNK